MDEYRQEMDKYRYKWQKYLYESGQKDECDLQCASDCINQSDVTDSMSMIFQECVSPKCKCMRVIEPVAFLALEEIEEDESKVPLVEEASQVNPYIDNCNLLCHKDCRKVKKVAPFPVLEMCVKDKCSCDHSLAQEFAPKVCNT